MIKTLKHALYKCNKYIVDVHYNFDTVYCFEAFNVSCLVPLDSDFDVNRLLKVLILLFTSLNCNTNRTLLMFTSEVINVAITLRAGTEAS